MFVLTVSLLTATPASAHAGCEVKKGTCHVSDYLQSLKSRSFRPHARNLADDHSGNRGNFRFRVDADGSGDCTSGFEADGRALESVHLPVPAVGRPVH